MIVDRKGSVVAKLLNTSTNTSCHHINPPVLLFHSLLLSSGELGISAHPSSHQSNAAAAAEAADHHQAAYDLAAEVAVLSARQRDLVRRCFARVDAMEVAVDVASSYWR